MQTLEKFQAKVNNWIDQLKFWWKRHQFKIMIVAGLIFLFNYKDVSLKIELRNPPAAETEAQMASLLERNTPDHWTGYLWNWMKQMIPVRRTVNESFTDDAALRISAPGGEEIVQQANHFGFFEKEKPMVKKRTPEEEALFQKRLSYINRFEKVAKAEMDKFGIPASITLAQGIVETNAGESSLVKKNNNHFGLKCFSKKCRKGHCSNFSDDSHKDFFRKFGSAWESYRAHSQLLTADRYKDLFQFGKDYEKWATGLKNAGYATDPQYARKLIEIIEEFDLYRLDQ